MSRCHLRRGIKLQQNSIKIHTHENPETFKQKDIGGVYETIRIYNFCQPRRRESKKALKIRHLYKNPSFNP
ncbi:hypothetical protein [Nostoc sp.]|uniref:hypothetical protein n=1 Tax=Nostoc sp. TaxID=1180 RepID=UPI002FFA60AA